MARESEVGQVVGAAASLRDHVVHLEFLVEHLLRRATVLTNDAWGE
jgi:hypothetical protein